MKWDVYYEKLGEWATSTMISRMSKLETFGPPDEICEVIYEIALSDETAAVRLLKKAIAAGVKFSGEHLSDLCLYCDDTLLEQAIIQSADTYTTKDLQALENVCDDDLLLEIAEKHRIPFPGSSASYEEETLLPDDLDDEYMYILSCLQNAKDNLDAACTFSAIDLYSSKKSVTAMKYAFLADAETQLDIAISVWNGMNVPEKEKSLLNDVLPGLGFMTIWQDFHSNSFFTEYLVNRRIQKVSKNVATAIAKISKLRHSGS